MFLASYRRGRELGEKMAANGTQSKSVAGHALLIGRVEARL
jgi:hypothetical protein